MFIGREYEKEILKKAIDSNRAELGIVYGRRRVGKSSLLQQFKKPGDLFFEGLQNVAGRKQIEHFLKQLAEQTQMPRMAASGWVDAFDALSHAISKGRRYVVLDEFPWMANGRSELVSLLKYYWDNKWKKNEKLTLILCGSIAGFMLQHIVHSRALHNRKTFEIKLDPLSASEAKLFFKNYRSDFELSRFLMIFGGVPKYLEQIDPAISLADNLDRLCFQKNGFFVTEFETLFKEQFKVTKNYGTIVKLLAEGSHSKESLAKRMNTKSGGGLSGYLEKLEQAGFIKTFHSLAFEGTRKKTRRIVLWDEFLKFYFSYMEPHQQIISANTKPGLFRALAEKSFDAYCGLAFERLCIKNFTSLLKSLGTDLSQVEDYGPFFRQPDRKKHQLGTQIDLLIRRKGHVLTLIECKFTAHPIGSSIIEEVDQKIRLLKAPRKFTVEKVLLSASGVTKDLDQEGCFHKILGIESIFQ